MEKNSKFPGFTAEVVLATEENPTQYVTYWSMTSESNSTTPEMMSGLVPQACACTPCYNLDPGPWCFRIFGRRVCIDIPSLGRWRGCCCTRWGWPPISCSIRRCG